MPESCIKQWYNKPIGDGCLQVVWAEGAMKQWHCCILYLDQVSRHKKSENTRFETLWLSPLTRLSIDVADSSLLLWLFSVLWAFCQAVVLLIYIFAMKIHICPVLDPGHIIHIFCLITPNFLLPKCVMIIAALAIYEAWLWVLVHIGKCLIYSQIRHIVRLFEF